MLISGVLEAGVLYDCRGRCHFNVCICDNYTRKKAFYFLLGWCQGHADRRLNAKIDHLQLFQIQLFG